MSEGHNNQVQLGTGMPPGMIAMSNGMQGMFPQAMPHGMQFAGFPAQPQFAPMQPMFGQAPHMMTPMIAQSGMGAPMQPMQGYSMAQMQGYSMMPAQMPQMTPASPLVNPGDHPLMRAMGDQYLVIRRPPPIPEVRVRCGRDEQCVKENGHRGRCSLQHRLREEDMLRLVEKISTLQSEMDAVRVERDRYQHEVSTCWSGVQKSCTFLSGIVCSKRQLKSGAVPTADECQAELRAIADELFQLESAERHEQFSAPLALLEQSLPDGEEVAKGTGRLSEIDEYKRQFEQRLAASREAHETATETAIAELVPLMMTAPPRLTPAIGSAPGPKAMRI